MDQNTDIISLQRQTVFGFRTLDDRALVALAAEQKLPLSLADLFLCRDHYCRAEWRDPTMGELLFLGAFFNSCRTLPCNTYVDALLSNDPEDQRVFADLQKKATALSGEAAPLSITQIMNTVGEVLKRLDIHPWHEAFQCSTVAELAARPDGAMPVLQIDGIATTLHTPKPKASRTAQTLVLLRGTTAELDRFARELRQIDHRYLATVGAEGLLPHLAALQDGVDLDLSTFSEYKPENGFASLSQIGQNGILLAMTYQYLPYLFSKGFSFTACGYLTSNHRLIVRYGNEICFSLATSLLQASGSRVLTPAISRSEPTTLSCEITAADGKLIGGVQTRGGCRAALCRLVADMAERGADFRRVSATAMLELPFDETDAAVRKALPLLLELHRVAAELAIPVCHSRQISVSATAAPRLSVFLAAERIASPSTEEAAALQNAAEQQDFAALRALLRK